MITPIELWNAAEQLAEGSLDGDSEFARRLVISRLYYAVFHSLQAAPATRSLPRATIDGGIPDAHDDPQNFDLKQFGRELERIVGAAQR